MNGDDVDDSADGSIMSLNKSPKIVRKNRKLFPHHGAALNITAIDSIHRMEGVNVDNNHHSDNDRTDEDIQHIPDLEEGIILDPRITTKDTAVTNEYMHLQHKLPTMEELVRSVPASLLRSYLSGFIVKIT